MTRMILKQKGLCAASSDNSKKSGLNLIKFSNGDPCSNLQNGLKFVASEVLTAVVIKYSFSLHITPCIPLKVS